MPDLATRADAITIETLPNERPAVPTRVVNRLPLPACCPVSKNPKPGSTLEIEYAPENRVLEVYSLRRAIQAYVGGHPSGIRNMETMLQQIAADAAAALGVPVEVRAALVLAPEQGMALTAWGGSPEEDCCRELREENARLREENAQLREENARLRKECAVSYAAWAQAYDAAGRMYGWMAEHARSWAKSLLLRPDWLPEAARACHTALDAPEEPGGEH